MQIFVSSNGRIHAQGKIPGYKLVVKIGRFERLSGSLKEPNYFLAYR